MCELKILDVSNNDLSTIPSSLGYIDSLHHLILDGNPLRAFKRSLIDDRAPISQLKEYLRLRDGEEKKEEAGEVASWTPDMRRAMEEHEADLSNRALADDIPPEFRVPELIVALHTLNLSNNQFSTLPPGLQAYTSSARSMVTTNSEGEPIQKQPFVCLNLSHNSLGTNVFFDQEDQRASVLWQLPLARLDLSFNQIQGQDVQFVSPPSSSSSSSSGFTAPSFPLSQHLTELNLSGNRWLDEFPLFLHLLPRLHTANLSYCSISWCDTSNLQPLPPALEVLMLGDNKVCDQVVTALLDKLFSTSITTLNIENNDIRTISPELARLPHLTHLMVQGNPQRSIRSHVIQEGPGAVVDLLKKRLG